MELGIDIIGLQSLLKDSNEDSSDDEKVFNSSFNFKLIKI